MSLNGKTMFISGASRGIGLAIAKRAARDGANIALIAKTAEPHPKLPGTVFTPPRNSRKPAARHCRSSGISATRMRSRPRWPPPWSSSGASISASTMPRRST